MFSFVSASTIVLFWRTRWYVPRSLHLAVEKPYSLCLFPGKKCKKAADEKTTFVAVMSDRLNGRLLVQWTTRPLHNTRVGGPWEDQQNDLCYNCKQSTLTVLKLLHKSKLI